MERVGALITKLQEQYRQHADISTIKFTTQMLLAELQLEAPDENNAIGNVAVVMPSSRNVVKTFTDEEVLMKNTVAEVPVPEIKKTEDEQLLPRASKVAEQINVEPHKAPEKNDVEEAALPKTTVSKPKKEHSGWLFDPVSEVPTLAHQKKQGNELNETIGDSKESLNEKLRVEKIELGSMLQDTPIRDLKKAIGVNDRYVFINELFRGDETMYERSMKTINSFNILPEAEFWIQRELKLKIGWDENSKVVHHFDQLLKRRFASI